MSNKFLHSTHLLYTCIAQLFSVMLCYGFAPRLFLRSTIIPVPKGGRFSSSNLDHFRSIAISSILSKILDNIIIDQPAHSLITSDRQFDFKHNSSRIQRFKSIYLQQPIHFATVLINKTYSTITRQIEITNNH